MAKVKLYCGVYGSHSVLRVEIERDTDVSDLQAAIARELSKEGVQVPPHLLTLYLARTTDSSGNVTWLKDDDHIWDKLLGPVDTAFKRMQLSWMLQKPELFGSFTLQLKTIHVLVKIEQPIAVPPTTQVIASSTESVTLHENVQDAFQTELQYYQERGQLIRTSCHAYCTTILNKIDALYALDHTVRPFVCVEGSSGMGKTQLAFALAGRRPYFYWLATSVGSTVQAIYKPFRSITSAFQRFMKEDKPTEKSERDVLDTGSDLYNSRALWTFGFIRALLKHCYQSDEHEQAPQMIRFDTLTTLTVTKCTQHDVCATMNDFKAAGKRLPFFILDEMTANENDGGDGKKMAGFQRNVFRVCGLVVVIMGTDSKVITLVEQSRHSRGKTHHWMSLVPHFPAYQVRMKAGDEEAAWLALVGKYPLVECIARQSRGLFARLFVDKVVERVLRKSDSTLCDLLDQAFTYVRVETNERKSLLSTPEKRYAQMMAVSYTNSDDTAEPPPAKRRRLIVGTTAMHLHFANLVDKQIADVSLSKGNLFAPKRKEWTPKCAFPAIEDDLLLYLAILGAKGTTTYHAKKKTVYSTTQVFTETKTFPVHENTQAISLDGKLYENMVAHAMFSASRRNGVQGIAFDEFFGCFLGEFRVGRWKKVTLQVKKNKKKGVVLKPSALFKGYVAEVQAVGHATIPFLAPVNAEWPDCILAANASGCKFGHLARPVNKQRCDVYVRGQTDELKPIFLCECKHRTRGVDMSVMKTIVTGLTAKWTWHVAVVVCPQLAEVQWTSELENVGCVKISAAGGINWVHQPVKEERKQLVIVVETGHLGGAGAVASDN